MIAAGHGGWATERAGWRGAAVASLLLLLAATGCGPRLDTTYGTVRGPSINGLSAFVQLLRDTGHATTASRRLPARIGPEVRTVVLVDDSFEALSDAAKESIDRWRAGPGEHTLLLLLRDGDAAIDYLRAIEGRDDVGSAEKAEARSLLADAERTLATEVSVARRATPPFPDGLAPRDGEAAPHEIDVRIRDSGTGEAPIRARIDLHRKPDGADGAETLWEADGTPLLLRSVVGRDECLVLVTALPLLNGSLVDPGNRSLAARLAAALPVDGELLVAGAGQVREDDEEEERSPWHLLTVQPLPWVALQTILAMGLFCWCTAPILGRPRRVRQDHAQDFSHHVEALAALLARAPAAGAAFAMRRLEEWRHAPRSPVARTRRRPPL